MRQSVWVSDVDHLIRKKKMIRLSDNWNKPQAVILTRDLNQTRLCCWRGTKQGTINVRSY